MIFQRGGNIQTKKHSEEGDGYFLEQHNYCCCIDHTSLPVLYNRKHPVPYLHVEHNTTQFYITCNCNVVKYIILIME